MTLYPDSVYIKRYPGVKEKIWQTNIKTGGGRVWNEEL